MNQEENLVKLNGLFENLKYKNFINEFETKEQTYDNLINCLEDFLSWEIREKIKILHFDPKSLYGSIYHWGRYDKCNSYRYHPNFEECPRNLSITIEGLVRRNYIGVFPEDRQLIIDAYDNYPKYIEINLNYPFMLQYEKPAFNILLPFERESIQQCFAYIYSIINGREITSIITRAFEEHFKSINYNKIILKFSRKYFLIKQFERSEIAQEFIKEYNEIQSKIFMRFEDFLESYMTQSQKSIRKDMHELHLKNYFISYAELSEDIRYKINN